MRISDWSSDVCSSDLLQRRQERHRRGALRHHVGEQPEIAARRGVGERPAGGIVDLDVPEPELAGDPARQVAVRSEERRVGKGCVSTCRSRWAARHQTNKEYIKT